MPSKIWQKEKIKTHTFFVVWGACHEYVRCLYVPKIARLEFDIRTSKLEECWCFCLRINLGLFNHYFIAQKLVWHSVNQFSGARRAENVLGTKAHSCVGGDLPKENSQSFLTQSNLNESSRVCENEYAWKWEKEPWNRTKDGRQQRWKFKMHKNKKA